MGGALERGADAAAFVRDAVAVVEGLRPGADAAEAAARAGVLALLRAHPAPLSRRSFDPGHLTASGVVLAPDLDAVALVLHAKLGRWLQPGGHVEPGDATVAAAARREVVEECGVELAAAPAPALLTVDVHPIPARGDEPAHLHHDVMFLFRARSTRLVRSSESTSLRWVRLDELDGLGLDASAARGIARARALAGPRPGS